MKKLFLSFVCLLSFQAALQAQTGISAAGTAPDASAMLDVIATDKGMLVPRVALVATNNSLLPIPSPADGLLVYNTGVGGVATKGFYYWDATNSLWQKIQSGSGNFVNGSGTQNYVTKWNNAAGTTIGNSQIFDNGTNVGVGNAAPNYKLDVTGQVAVDAPTGYGARLTVGQTATDYPANAGWGGTWNANILLNALDRSSVTFHDAGTSVGALSYQANLFSFDGAGSWGPVNLGINARTPLSRLHVSGGTPTGIGALPANTVQIIENGSANNYLTFRNTIDNGTYSGIQFQDNNVGGYIAFRNYTGSGANDGTNGDYMVYGTYTDHIFQTGASETVNGKTEVMRIKQNGNVGIGNTGPAEKLDVSGNIKATGVVYWGNGLTRTETRDDAGTQGGRSGFYETSVPAPAANWYAGASGWQHLLETRHSNPANNYAMQFAGSFYDQDVWLRKTNNNAAQNWTKITTSRDISYAKNEYYGVAGPNAWKYVTGYSAWMDVRAGDKIKFDGMYYGRLTGGSNNDYFYTNVEITGQNGCGNYNPNQHDYFHTNETGSDHDNFKPVPYMDVWDCPCTGQIRFRLMIYMGGDDNWEAREMIITGTRY